jgi:hypothetical protein
MHARDIGVLKVLKEGGMIRLLNSSFGGEGITSPEYIAMREMVGTYEDSHWLTRFVVASLLNLSTV